MGGGVISPVTVIFSAQRMLYGALALAAWSAAMFGTGYLYKWHLVGVESAAREAKQSTVTTTAAAAVTVSDTAAADKLKLQLAAAAARARTLEQIIKDQAHETPPTPDCRLPDRVRDAINDNLAAGSR